VAGGIGGMLGGADSLEARAAGGGSAAALVPWVTAMVGYWATLSLNIPDFTRYARSQRDQAVGQAVGLLTTMPFIAAVGVLVTGATVVRYGEAIWNPVDLLARLSREAGHPLIGGLAMLAVLVATLTTNIAANIVAPANSFANWSPRTISFRTGGLLAGTIAIVIAPWALLDRYQTWLLTYSGLLGAVGGVLTCDYVVIRRGVLVVPDLYAAAGRYTYRGGVNPAAFWALIAGVAVAGLGLASPALAFLFDGAWFSAALVSGVVYFVLMRRSSPTGERQQRLVKVVA
jgi:NCS1 family nucleobase:cation symporter-1